MHYDVWIEKTAQTQYPSAPFNPGAVFPELASLCYPVQTDAANEVYGAVRETLLQLGLDAEHAGTAQWNPLGGLLLPGQMVVLKPNFVRGSHIWGERGTAGMITHAAVLRPLIDYALLALHGRGRIVVGDAPMRSSSWQEITARSGTDALVAFYAKQNVTVELIDFRRHWTVKSGDQVLQGKVENPARSAKDYVEVDLHEASALSPIIGSCHRFDMGDVKYGTIEHYHNAQTNNYLIAREILEADLVISVPKLKTHRMAGLTCAMKNLVGINGEKERIAHFRRGVKGRNADEFEKFNLRVFLRERIWTYLKSLGFGWSKWLMTRMKRFVQRMFWHGKSYEEVYAVTPPKLYREGGWQGNDTLWRCVHDLNRILLYADRAGRLQPTVQRQVLYLVDGIVAGEGEGPLANTPKPLGVIFGGTSAVAVDFAAAAVMRFDYHGLPLIQHAFDAHPYPLIEKKPEEITLGSNVPWEQYSAAFVPTSGWHALQDSLKQAP